MLIHVRWPATEHGFTDLNVWNIYWDMHLAFRYHVMLRPRFALFILDHLKSWPPPLGGQRKSMKWMCETFDQHCKMIKETSGLKGMCDFYALIMSAGIWHVSCERDSRTNGMCFTALQLHWCKNAKMYPMLNVHYNRCKDISFKINKVNLMLPDNHSCISVSLIIRTEHQLLV